MFALILVLRCKSETLTIDICQDQPTEGCLTWDNALSSIQSSTLSEITVNNAQGVTASITLQSQVSVFSLSSCKNCNFEIRSNVFISSENCDGTTLTVYGNQDIRNNMYFQSFKAPIFGDTKFDIVYHYESQQAESLVPVFSTKSSQQNNRIQLVYKGTTYTTRNIQTFNVESSTYTLVSIEVEQGGGGGGEPEVLEINICGQESPPGCVDWNTAKDKMQSNTDKEGIILANANGITADLTFNRNIRMIMIESCNGCSFTIRSNTVVQFNGVENTNIILYADQTVLFNYEYQVFQSPIFINGNSKIGEVTLYFNSPNVGETVSVCSIGNILDDGAAYPDFVMPTVKLVLNGVTHTDLATKVIDSMIEQKLTLFYYRSASVTDTEICVGDNPGCTSVDEAANIIDKTTAESFSLNGDGSERNLVINPKDTMFAMGVSGWKGSITVNRNDLHVSFSQNAGLSMNIKATGKFQKAQKKELERVLCVLEDIDHGVNKIDFTISDIDNQKEIYVLYYFKVDGLKIPELSASGDGRKYTLKTKEIDISNLSKKLREEESTTVTVAYFEVGSKLGAGEIAGIVIGCIVGVAAIAVGVFFVIKKRGARENSSDPNATV